MTSLQKLNISNGDSLSDMIMRCGVGDFGIKELKLKKLTASLNNKITNLNFMTSLKNLYINCGNRDVFICTVGYILVTIKLIFFYI